MFSTPETTNEPLKTTFTIEQIKAIKSDLAKLRPARPARPNARLTVKDAVMQLAPTLAKKKSQGFTNAELAEELGKRGIFVKATTLGKYINAALKKETAPLKHEQVRNTPIQEPALQNE